MKPIPALILAVLLCLGSLSAPRAELIRTYSVAKATTRVGLARVVLELDELALDGNRLVGNYRIRVPLAPMMNDRGTIRLELPESLERAVARAGVIRGSGHSDLDGRTHSVTCAFERDGGVRIRIEAGERILNFLTRLSPAS